jgi:hypothetical protein
MLLRLQDHGTSLWQLGQHAITLAGLFGRSGVAPWPENRMGEAGAAGPGPISAWPSVQPVVCSCRGGYHGRFRRKLPPSLTWFGGGNWDP